MSTTIEIKLVRSTISTPDKQRKVISGLGLKKLNQTVSHADTPEIRGMIAKVSHMVEIV